MSKESKKTCYANVGGQALMDGILMRSPAQSAFVVRVPSGALHIEKSPNKSVKDKYKLLAWPIIRGPVTFIESMLDGYRALNRSIELTVPIDESLSEKDKKKEENLTGAAIVLGVILGLALTVGMMILLPTWLAGLINDYVFEMPDWLRAVFEGVLKIVIFLAYISLCTLNRDIKRVFMYHGAEHKTIFCHEKGLELTVENVKAQSRFHPRCGTSFIVLMIGVGILVAAFIPSTYVPDGPNIVNVLIRSALKLLTLPVVLGIGYELLKLCGKYDNTLTRIIAAPGLWFQRLTTKEPDEDGIIQVGIASLQSALDLPITVPTEPESTEVSVDAVEAVTGSEADGASTSAESDSVK